MKAEDLERNRLYYDRVSREVVVFKYLGQTGSAIVCEPGEELAGMQSSWAIAPGNLDVIKNDHLLKPRG